MIRLGAAFLTTALAAVLLFAQPFAEFKFEHLAKGFRFTEGPAWNAKDGYLIFSDTPSDRLLKWVPGEAAAPFRADAHGPAGNAFDAQGRLYTCETRTRRVTRTDRTGKIEVLASQWEGKKLNAPNGIAVAKSGSVYFTDPAFGAQSDHRELDFHGVFHIAPKGGLTLVAKYATRPHGIAISPNGKTLYVSNTDEHNVRAFDLDKNGEASNERVLVSRIVGPPGGMAVDEKGNLYVVSTGLGIYAPDGKRLQFLEMNETSSAAAFGEADMKSLFLTSRGDVLRARPEAQ
jgi:gluconolactonase